MPDKAQNIRHNRVYDNVKPSHKNEYYDNVNTWFRTDNKVQSFDKTAVNVMGRGEEGWATMVCAQQLTNNNVQSTRHDRYSRICDINAYVNALNTVVLPRVPLLLVF